VTQGVFSFAHEALGAELEAALLRELAEVHAQESWARFRGKLKRPRFALSAAAGTLGRWIPATRTIELSRALVTERPWPEVISVLQHEMAHQYVDEVLRVRDETAHGDTFREVCEKHGIDGAPSGAPVPAADVASPNRVLERVRKLLALAGSANRHEAEQAMRRAHELMLRHEIDAAAANGARGFDVRHVGDPLKRTSAVESAIFVLLDDCFFVRVIRIPVWIAHAGRRGAVHELVGARANLELALHVHGFLLATAERLWLSHRAERDAPARDRLEFQAGVVRGFHDKLVAERGILAGTGLVWVGDAALETQFRRRHPRITRRSTTIRASDAHAAGLAAGKRVILHKPVADGPGAARRQLAAGTP
jgi:hypothetical protein